MLHNEIVYAKVPQPEKDCSVPVFLNDETLEARKNKVLKLMRAKNLDKLIVYCDAEHSGNFSYLIGYYTRFEESLLVLDKNGEMVLMLGNENLNKCSKARFQCRAVHVSLFSLPNQPNRNDKSFKELLMEAGIAKDQRIGIAGWKYFTSSIDCTAEMFDVPSFIVDEVRNIVGRAQLVSNETSIFIGENGVRTTNNANEIAHYEYGAALASDCILETMNAVVPGISELELGDKLERYGQHTTVTTIASTGERFVKANMFPINRKVQIGDPMSLTVGYTGGSSSRAGYAVHRKEELPEKAQEYMEELAMPYFGVYVTWLKEIHIGMTGGQMFQIVEKTFPREKYHWSLCPGHLTAEEEWLSSPIYESSEEILKSGMIFQIDIIPSKENMAGICAESTVVLADKALKKQIQEEYPDMWERMKKRICYIQNVLNIELSDDVLPMCSTVAYLRPYLLNKDKVLIVKK